MNLATRFKRSVLAVVLLSLATYGLAQEQSPFALGLMIAAFFGWWITETMPGRGLPRWLVGVLLLIIVFRGLFDAHREGISVSPFSGLLASIIVIKLWERRQIRDYAQILSISLFLNIGSILNSNSLAVGLMLIALVPVYVYAVMLLQMYAPGERVADAARASGVPITVSPTLARSTGRQLAIVSAGALLTGLVISFFVFVLLPRGIGDSRLFGALGRPSLGRVTGFTDRVQLGIPGLISQSQAVVMEVTLSGPGRENYLKAEGSLYLRGAVLDQYAHGAWTGERNADDGLAWTNVVPGQNLPLVRARTSGQYMQQEIRMRGVPDGVSPLFAVWQPTDIQTTGDADMAAKGGTVSEIGFNAAQDSVYRRGNAGPIRYRVLSSSPAASDEHAVNTGRRAVSFDSPLLTQFASGILRDAGISPDPSLRPVAEDALAARVLTTYLRTNFSYTLDILAPARGEDPIEWFVFQEKKGHCEYFASALAALCRSVGINARVVAGYLAAESDEQQRKFTVRQSNAHAWTEVETSRGSWRTFDATPDESLAQITRPRSGFAATFDRWLDDIETGWSNFIVNFDRSSRDRIFGARQGRSDWPNRIVNAVADFFAPQEKSGGSTFPLIRVLAILLAAVGLFVVLLVIRRRRSVRARAIIHPAVHGPEGVIYAQSLLALTRMGHDKPEWQPPRQFALDLRSSAPDAAEAFSGIIDLCYRSWFAGEPLTPAELTTARAGLNKLNAAARRDR